MTVSPVCAKYLRRFRDPDCQIALGDRDGADPDILAHYDDTGRLVDHDLGGNVRGHTKLFHVRDESNSVAPIILRNDHPD